MPAKHESNYSQNKTKLTDTQTHAVDLSGTRCPMAFVKARLVLDTLKEGSVVRFLYEATPANDPLQRSISALGHNIMSVKHNITPKEHPSTEQKSGETNKPLSPMGYPETVELIQMIVEVKKNRS